MMDVIEERQPETDHSIYFQGHVDTVNTAIMSGWAICTDSLSEKVEMSLWLDGRRVSNSLANVYRADLKSVGDGDGKCAFEVEIPEFIQEHVKKNKETLSLRMSCAGYETELLGGQGFAGNIPSPAARKRVGEAIRQLLFYKGQMLGDSDSNEPFTPVPSNREDHLEFLHRAVGQKFEEINKSNANQLQLSPYSIYTRDRVGLTRSFDFEKNPQEAENWLAWYVEHYTKARKGWRVPLSREEIAYCNSMVFFPGCEFQLSKIHLQRLMRRDHELPLGKLLSNEKIYQDHVFNWVDHTARGLSVEDALIPTHYMEVLRRIPAHWKGQLFGINDYFERKHKSTTSWHCFNLAKNADRGCMYLVALLESISNPTIARFISDEIRSSLFTPDAEGKSSFAENIINSVLSQQEKSETQGMDILMTIDRLLREKGYDLTKEKWLTINANGDRRHSLIRTHRDIEDAHCDIQIIGPMSKASGLGQAARLSALSLQQAGFCPNIFNFNLDNPSPEGFSTAIDDSTLKKAKVNLLHLNAEAVPIAAAYMPDVFADSYNIGYFFWELDTPAACHNLALEFLDEVWVSTEFGITQYKPATDIPVINVGMTVEEHKTPNKEQCRKKLAEEYGIGEDETVFLTTFDSYSFIQRKNPLAAIHAFTEAFSDDEPVRLLIKTQNRSGVMDPSQKKIWRTIDSLVANDPRIILVNRTFKYDDLLAFKKAADCYVSLHRSEGWGFGMIESMLLEIPVIATGYSGNLEYCNSDNCWLVDSEEVYLGADDYIFVKPGQKWAEPNLVDATRCFREVHTDPNKRIAVADNAVKYVRENFGNEAISKRYRTRMQSILDSLEPTDDSTPALAIALNTEDQAA